jgi:hypothetical protein
VLTVCRSLVIIGLLLWLVVVDERVRALSCGWAQVEPAGELRLPSRAPRT